MFSFFMFFCTYSCNRSILMRRCRYLVQAKFLFMVRDGRATVNSIITRKVTITGFDLSSYRQCMTKWNHAIETMHNQCKEIGSERCMMVNRHNRQISHLSARIWLFMQAFSHSQVYYEQLVLHPEEWMRKILKFLDVPWNDSVLHHEEFINKPNGVSLSK